MTLCNIYMTYKKSYITLCNMEVTVLKNKRMKLARVERDYSQEQLAEAVGVARQTIGMIEAGNYNPSLNLCIAICKALNSTLNDLFWEEAK